MPPGRRRDQKGMKPPRNAITLPAEVSPMGWRSVRFAALLVAALAVVAGGAARSGAGKERKKLEVATFAGGCFWCMEPPFDKLDGVISTISGYAGGKKKNPTYEEVSAGNTGHAEVVQVTYDPKKITYEKLLEVFWRNVDPLTPNRQFCDAGSQYRTVIFYHDETQKRLAEESKKALSK